MARLFAATDVIIQAAPALHRGLSWRMKTTASSAGNIGVVGRSNTTGLEDGFCVYISVANKLAAFSRLGIGFGAWGGEASTIINDGAWHSVMMNMSYQGPAGFELYIDGGVEVSSGGFGFASFGNPAFPYTIGRVSDVSFDGYVGEIADFAIYSDWLNANDARSLSLGLSPLKVRPDLLVEYMPLVRDIFDMRDVNGAATLSGTTTVTPHPRVLG